MGKEINLLMNAFEVVDTYKLLSKRYGAIIPTSQLKEHMKSHKNIFSPRASEIDAILRKLCIAGIVFYPKRGFIQRI